MLGIAVSHHARKLRGGRLLSSTEGTELVIDPAGLIADAGGSPPHWPGVSRGHLEGVPLLSLVIQQDQPAVAAALAEALAGNSCDVSCQGIHDDGTPWPLTVHLTPVADPQGGPCLGAVASVREE